MSSSKAFCSTQDVPLLPLFPVWHRGSFSPFDDEVEQIVALISRRTNSLSFSFLSKQKKYQGINRDVSGSNPRGTLPARSPIFLRRWPRPIASETLRPRNLIALAILFALR